jgi:hypothetical protein
VLVSEYLTPLRENGMLSKDEVKNLFGDVEAIRNYNRLLLEQLETRMKQWEEVNNTVVDMCTVNIWTNNHH